ncbi:MAG: SurA N-terminal domain-containing protein [Bacteroidetes bacterium]|nr:SurA N-terminal domain-containing protein [Bacteroidota bacterium]
MAILGSIRKYSVLVMIVIGLGLFLFIGGDFFSNQGPTRSNELAEINDVVISPADYENKVQQEINVYKQRTGITTLDDQTIEIIRTQVWNELKADIVLNNEYIKLGIGLGEDELENMTTGPNPHQQVVQSFKDPQTGQFNSNLVAQYLQQMDNDASGSQRAQWLLLENAIVKERIRSKYTSLVKQGMYVTGDEVQNNISGNNRLATIKYVLKEYRSIPDSAVDLSDSQIEDYYNDHINDYEQEASRTAKCVVFDVRPSEEDTRGVEEWIEQIRVDFADRDDDSLYVNMNADTRFSGLYNTRGELPLHIDSMMFEAEVGYVSDVFVEGRVYRVAKLLEKKNAPDSAKARNIMIGFNDEGAGRGTITKADAKALADSLYNLLQTDSSVFAELAIANSDAGNAQNGGLIDWFEEADLFIPISDLCFDAETDTGEVYFLETEGAFHIVELTDRTQPVDKIKVAIVDRLLEPGNATYQDLYAISSEFAGKNNNADAFNEAIKSSDIAPLVRTIEGIKKGDRSIGGIEGSRKVVKWINNAEEGDVSSAIEIGETYFVVLVEDIFHEGNTPLEKIKVEVESAARKARKGELLQAEVQAALTAGSDIEGAAEELGLDVNTAVGVSFSSDQISTIGPEPVVVGTTFGLEEGETSQPVKGNEGVFIILLESIQELTFGDPNTAKSILISGAKAKADYLLFNAIMDNADVTDNRSDFY